EECHYIVLSSLQKLRARGVRVAFDSNYRQRLWKDKQTAQKAMLSILESTDSALLTLDDEHLLWGDDSVAGCVERYKHTGINELVLKRGADETIIISNQQELRVSVTPVDNIVDTTGAGDTFNAGYLAARLNGASEIDA